MKTQDEIILEYLQTNDKGITQLEATSKFGFTRLSAIVHRLRKAEYKINAKRESDINRYGRKISYVRYYLSK